jgi:hypothetical protein
MLDDERLKERCEAARAFVARQWGADRRENQIRRPIRLLSNEN